MNDREKRIERRQAVEEVFNHHAMIGAKDPHVIAKAVFDRAKEKDALLIVPYMQKENTSLFLAPGPEIGQCTLITRRYDPIREKNIYGFETKTLDDFIDDLNLHTKKNFRRLENILVDESLLSSLQEEEDVERISGAYTDKSEMDAVEKKRDERLTEIKNLYGEKVVSEILQLQEYQKFIADYNRLTGDGMMAHPLADPIKIRKNLEAEWAEEDGDMDHSLVLATRAAAKSEKPETGGEKDVTTKGMTRSLAADALLKMLLRPQKQN